MKLWLGEPLCLIYMFPNLKNVVKYTTASILFPALKHTTDSAYTSVRWKGIVGEGVGM